MKTGIQRKFHLLTPFSREQWRAILIDYLRPLNVEWHPILSEGHETKESAFQESWIHPITVTPRRGLEPCYDKINQWIETQVIVDDDYYLFFNDDDFYSYFFFQKLADETADVVFVSMARGFFKLDHDCTTLFAHPNNVRVGSIGLEQMMVKGHILRKLRFNSTTPCADGELAVHLKQNYPVTYRADAFVLFNFFQPGRW